MGLYPRRCLTRRYPMGWQLALQAIRQPLLAIINVKFCVVDVDNQLDGDLIARVQSMHLGLLVGEVELQLVPQVVHQQQQLMVLSRLYL